MKIVQSLWSKPALLAGGYQTFTGHWGHPRFFWYSWVLSTGWAYKHYGNIALVTDNEGARWLVDKLKLPFTSVKIGLENIAISGELWAYGKIIAYSLQTEPFFHIDGDVYLTGKLPERYEKAQLLCQFFEQAPGYSHYDRIYTAGVEAIERFVPKLPAFWRYTKEQSAANCGIFGGTDVAAIRKYTSDVISMMTDPANQAGWKRLNSVLWMSCVIEQLTLWCSAREQGVILTPLFENTDFCDLEAFRRKALQVNFNHAAGEAKSPGFGAELARRVQAEYPEQFRIIDGLFPPWTESLRVHLYDGDRLE